MSYSAVALTAREFKQCIGLKCSSDMISLEKCKTNRIHCLGHLGANVYIYQISAENVIVGFNVCLVLFSVLNSDTV